MGLFNHEAANRALDASGAPVQDAIRKIYLQGAASNAPAYQDPDLTIMRVSDMKSDALGYFDLCYVQDGEYRVEIESPQGDILYSADNVFVGSHLRTQELDEYNSTDQLRDDVFLSYQEVTGRYPVRPGQKILICSTDIQYKVMPAEESVPQLVSAGGVKFCQTGTRYTDLGCFKHAVARGESFSAGTMVFAGGTIFSFDDDGNTNLPGLTGWRRVVSPENDADLAQAKAKTDLVSVTQPVNLDVVPALVAESNAYASVAEGLAGTADGQLFFVPAGPGLQLYRNDAGQGTFVGWHGEIQFESLTELQSEVAQFPMGVTLRTRQEGFVYQVAEATATDHHLTTVGGTKLYVTPRGGSFDAEAFGVVASGENVGAEFMTAVQTALQGDMALRLPTGTILLDNPVTGISIPRGKTLHLFAEGQTALYIEKSFGIKSEKVSETLLSSEAPRKSKFITLDTVSGVEVGDLLYVLAPTTRVETGWGYRKQCIRRVAAIDGNTIFLDQALDFSFTVEEGTRVECYATASIRMSGVKVEVAAGDRKILFLNLCDSHISNGGIKGQVAGWDQGWSDGMAIVGCDRFTMDHFNFEKLRYGPQITAGSRFIEVKNCTAKNIRHLDVNNWAQDVLFENVTGISTDGIIQCHPCIRPVWKNCTDSVTRPGLYGIDLRGLGERVEDCTVSHIHPEVGSNTNAPLLSDEYLSMAQEYTRRITRLRAPYTALGSGKEGRMVVEESVLGGLSSGMYTAKHTDIEVDDLTLVENRITTKFDPMMRTNFDRTLMRGNRATVAPYTQYRNRTVITPIKAITKGLPATVTTLYGHDLRTGDEVEISGVEGMLEANGNTYVVTVVDSTSFTLDGTDSSNFDEYTAAGLAELQTPIREVEAVTQSLPAVVASPGHGYSDGDVVWINGVQGMSEVNRTYFKVSAADTDSFALASLDGHDVDATGFGAYSGGGKVTLQEEVLAIEAASSPACGVRDRLLLRSQIYSGWSSGERYYRFKVKYRAFEGGGVDQNSRWGVMRVVAMSNVGRSIAEYPYQYDAQSGNFKLEENISNIPNAVCVVTVEHAGGHLAGEVSKEGEANWTYQQGFRHYITFDVIVDVSSQVRILNDVVIEFDEQRQVN